MTLTLYYHPLSSFCHKALIALYENNTPFVSHLVDLGDPDAAAAFRKLWPVGKFPVLHDTVGDRIIPESSIIIEYLTQHYPGATALVPADPDLARQTRLRDRVFDLYMQVPMQKIVADRMRPAGAKDAFGVDQAQAQLRTAYDLVDRELAGKTWAMGDSFTMADCAAVPALFYGNMVVPFVDTHPNLATYLARLKQRPSVARVLKEAEPYLHLVPKP